MKTVAIVNPVAGFRKAPRTWPYLLEKLGRSAAHVVTWWTKGPGDGEALAARARREGFQRIVVVGGDGSLFDVANGLWWENAGNMPGIGVVPLGTGCDYVRNFQIGCNLLENLIIALGESTLPIDAAVCRLESIDRHESSRVFVNVMGLGYDGKVIERFKRRRFKVPGRLPYVLSALQELPSFREYWLEGEMDGNCFRSHSSIFVAGLGRYFGGGLMITPHASPCSGLFHVVWAEKLRRLELLHMVRETYGGRHLAHPKVCERFTRHLKLTASPPAYVEAEGELIGRTPLELDVCPMAFQFAALGYRS
jgi:diacylglycerol kinase (ATP)